MFDLKKELILHLAGKDSILFKKKWKKGERKEPGDAMIEAL